MKKRKLADLMRSLPTPDDLKYLSSDEFKHLPDRAAAILLAATMEALLEATVLDALPNGSPDVHKALLSEAGAMGSFAAKIDLALALNVISVDCQKDFHIIRKIRNVFAHARTEVSFATPEISEACAKLTSRMPLGMLFGGWLNVDPIPRYPAWSTGPRRMQALWPRPSRLAAFTLGRAISRGPAGEHLGVRR